MLSPRNLDAVRLLARRVALATLMVLAALGPMLSPSPLTLSETDGVALAHWWWGGRRALLVGGGATLLSMGLGTFVGLTAAYLPALVPRALARAVETSHAVPALIMVVLWRLFSTDHAVVGFVVIMSGLKGLDVANLACGTTRELLSLGYVNASRALGGTERRIFLTHVWPELSTALLAYAPLVTAQVLASEAALHFVDLGLPGPPSWAGYLGQAAREGTAQSLGAWLCLLSVLLCFAAFSRPRMGNVQRVASAPAVGASGHP